MVGTVSNADCWAVVGKTIGRGTRNREHGGLINGCKKREDIESGTPAARTNSVNITQPNEKVRPRDGNLGLARKMFDHSKGGLHDNALLVLLVLQRGF